MFDLLIAKIQTQGQRKCFESERTTADKPKREEISTQMCVCAHLLLLAEPKSPKSNFVVSLGSLKKKKKVKTCSRPFVFAEQ